MKCLKLFRMMLLLPAFLCVLSMQHAWANGCTGSQFRLSYNPGCADCWQLCAGQNNAYLISDCNSLTHLSLDWGDGNIDTFQLNTTNFPCHKYANPGTYTATLRIKGPCHSWPSPGRYNDCAIPQTIVVTNSPGLNAAFSADTVCYTDDVLTLFTSTSTATLPNSLITYHWDFGDGSPIVSGLGLGFVPNVTHHYTRCGAYDARLIISESDPCCPTADTVVHRIFVKCPPFARSNPLGLTEPYIYESSASLTMNEVCVGGTTQFQLVKSDSITSFTYTFANGGSSTIPNPSHVYDFCPPYQNWVRVDLMTTQGCPGSIDSVAVVHCLPVANFAGITGTLCAGDCNGTATINITNGTPNYTIQWGTSPPQSTPTAINLCPGPYNVTVTDAHNCRDTTTLNVFSPNPFVGTATSENIMCNGWLTGTAVLTFTGGTPPNTFYWTPGGDTSQNASGLGPGTYTVIATDANGCTFTSTTSITEPPPVTATFTHTDAQCGLCDGTATVTPASGTPGTPPTYTYLWSNGQTTQTATGLCSGIYFVEVTDSVPGCTSRFSVAIGNVGGYPVSLNVQNVSCGSSCDGSATATIGLACPACTFEWLDDNGVVLPQSTSTAVNLCPGNYISRVTNPADGCQTLSPFTIIVPTPLFITPAATRITCNNLCDGTVSVTVSGGTGTYTYEWRDASNVLVGSTPNVGSLCPGLYTIRVTDQAGCFEVDTAIVNTYVFTGITAATAISCFGDCNAQILATGQIGTLPYTFAWDSAGTPIGTNSPILANLCAGTYNVRITDATNCAITLPPVTITQPPLLTATVSSTPASCYGVCDGATGVVAAGGTPGYTYQWANAQIVPIPSATTTSMLNLCAGLFHIQVTDTNNCTSPWTPVTVTQPDSITITLAVTQPYCGTGNVGSIDATVSGGTASYTYLWTTGETTEDITGITVTGTYCITVTDANGCIKIACADIVQPAPLNTTISSPTVSGFEVDCYGHNSGTIYLNVTGGVQPYSYQWNPPAANNDTLDFLYVGTYMVTVTDSTGCSIYDTITLREPPQLLHPVAVVHNPCTGDSLGSITLLLSGGIPLPNPPFNNPYVAHWNCLTDTSLVIADTTLSISGLPAGIYRVVFGGANCYLADTIEVLDPQPLSANFSIVNGACAGGGTGSITLTPSGGTPGTTGYTYTWTWSNGGSSITKDLTGLSPDSYFVTITDSNLCQVSDTAVVIEPTPLVAAIQAVGTSCFGGADGSIDVTVTGGSPAYLFAWNLVTDTTEDLTDVASGNYLVTVTDQGGCKDTVGIFVDQPSPIFGSGTLTRCDGDSALLGGIWRKAPGVFDDTATTAAGCDSFVTVTLGFVPFFQVNDSALICFGDTFVLSNGDFYTVEGTYTDSLLASGGCDSIVSITVDVFDDIGLYTAPADSFVTVLGEGVPIEVLTTSGLTISRYEWTPADGLSCTDCASTIATPEVPVTYTVRGYVDVNASLTCPDSDTIRILFDEEVLVFIPNAFTPDGDGINDYFMIYGRGFAKFNLKVFDRWGEKMFESGDQNIGWDGTYRGKKLNPGVFVYVADIEFTDKTKPNEYLNHWKGSVTLIR